MFDILSLPPSWGSVNSPPARVYTVFNNRKWTYRPQPPKPLIEALPDGHWMKPVLKDMPERFQNFVPKLPIRRKTTPEEKADVIPGWPSDQPLRKIVWGNDPLTKEALMGDIRIADEALQKHGYTFLQRSFVHQQVMSQFLNATSLSSQVDIILDAFHESGVIDAERAMKEFIVHGQ